MQKVPETIVSRTDIYLRGTTPIAECIDHSVGFYQIPDPDNGVCRDFLLAIISSLSEALLRSE
jgi:hypothetical protein